MKRKLLTLIICFMGVNLFAQSPNQMSFQAVLRDSNDNLIPNTNVGIRLSILQGSPTGVSIYTELHSVNTNANSLISLKFGDGTIVLGSIDGVDWGGGSYFLKTEVDPAGGSNYTIVITSPFLSVPYALHANTADSLTNSLQELDPLFAQSLASGITSLDTTYWNSKLDIEKDSSVTNEIQFISKTGTTVTLSHGGGTFQDSIRNFIAGDGITISGDTIAAIPGTGNTHYIGELFGGGIIFLIYDNGTHGLIASLDDLDNDTGAVWGLSGIIVANCQSLTDGVANTASIIAAGGSSAEAASLCDNYTGGGFYRLVFAVYSRT